MTAPPAEVAVPVIPAGPIDGMLPAYRQRYAEAVANITVELRIVSPEWAAGVLANANDRNRKLSLSWRRIATAIQRGDWWPNGEAVVFDRDGKLINGQHRLKAITEAKCPVPCLVIRGVAPEAFATFDQGKKRTASDVLSIVGHENVVTLASALGWHQAYTAGEMDNIHARRIANSAAAELATTYPELCESVTWVKSHYSRLIPPGLLAFLHFQFTVTDRPLAEQFFARVVEGVDVQRGMWEFILRKRLEEAFGGRRAAGDQVEIAVLVIKAWNKLRTGEPCGPGSLLRYSPGANETFPEIR